MSSAFEAPEVRDDDRGGAVGLWVRRAVLALLAVLVVVALLNVFGQEPSDSTARAAAATVTLSAPKTLRGGLLFQSRLQIDASRTIDHLRLVLDDGWLEGMQISSIEPAATSESSRDGRVVLSYGRLRDGDRIVIWVQSQVDPTNPGRRRYGLTVQDATTDIVRLNRTITVLP